MDRAEHLQWCKNRAMEYVDRGEINDALASMGSDLNKHPDTKDHAGIQLGMALLLGGQMNTVEDARKYINGFN